MKDKTDKMNSKHLLVCPFFNFITCWHISLLWCFLQAMTHTWIQYSQMLMAGLYQGNVLSHYKTLIINNLMIIAIYVLCSLLATHAGLLNWWKSPLNRWQCLFWSTRAMLSQKAGLVIPHICWLIPNSLVIRLANSFLRGGLVHAGTPERAHHRRNSL